MTEPARMLAITAIDTSILLSSNLASNAIKFSGQDGTFPATACPSQT